MESAPAALPSNPSSSATGSSMMYYVMPFDQSQPSTHHLRGDPLQSLIRSVGFFLPLILFVVVGIAAYLYLENRQNRENHKNLMMKMQAESDRIHRFIERQNNDLYAELYAVKSGVSAVLSKVVDDEKLEEAGDEEDFSDEDDDHFSESECEDEGCSDGECKKLDSSSPDSADDMAMAELLSKIQ